jgi:CMP-N-acetylneuraminic acid synthetase
VHDRPSNLAQDTSLVIDSIRSLVESIEQNESSFIDIIVLLECTSPIKSVMDIDKGIEQVINHGFDSATSLTETDISPNRLWKISNNKLSSFIEDSEPFLPRQEQPKAYQLTGQFYVLSKKILNENPCSISILLGKVYPLISTSKLFFDIDEEMDLFIAEQYLKYYENN